MNVSSFTLITLINLLIGSGSIHPNPGPSNTNEMKKALKLSHVNMTRLCPISNSKLDDLYEHSAKK